MEDDNSRGGNDVASGTAVPASLSPPLPQSPPGQNRHRHQRRRTKDQMTMIAATPSPKAEMDSSWNFQEAFMIPSSSAAAAAAAAATDLNFLPSLLAGHRRRSVMAVADDIVVARTTMNQPTQHGDDDDDDDHDNDEEKNSSSAHVAPSTFGGVASSVGCSVAETMNNEFPTLMNSISSLGFMEEGSSYIFSSQRRRVSPPPAHNSDADGDAGPTSDVKSPPHNGQTSQWPSSPSTVSSFFRPKPEKSQLTPNPSFHDEEMKLDNLVMQTMSNQQHDEDEGLDDRNKKEQVQKQQPGWSLMPLKGMKSTSSSTSRNNNVSQSQREDAPFCPPLDDPNQPRQSSPSTKPINSRISIVPSHADDVSVPTTISHNQDGQQLLLLPEQLRPKSTTNKFNRSSLDIESADRTTLRRNRSGLSHVSVVSEGGQMTHRIIVKRPYKVKEHYVESMFYVSVSAILGSVVRTYMARFFGNDCEDAKYLPEYVIHDFLTPLSSQICVTNGGRTIQTGGALFFDFPANVLGSFIMGIITPQLGRPRTRFPWLHRDHALQRDDVFHASLATGFCGCLTTLSSWNNQMVVMLDGTYCEMGSQVVTVLFGYTIGIMGAAGGFQFGQQVGVWWYEWKHRHEPPIDLKASESETSTEDDAQILHRHASTHQPIELVHHAESESDEAPDPNYFHKIPLFLASLGLLVAFLVGDLHANIEWYKGMAMLWIFAPAGSLLRWRLSELNNRSDKRLCKNLPRWVPWGTLTANISAAAIGALLVGMTDRYYGGTGHTTAEINGPWFEASLFALTTGFAGSLSTVSTMVKEATTLSEQYQGQGKAHYYQLGTCLLSLLIGLMVYATTIRL